MFHCRALIKLFYPVRSNALNYMSQLSDGELRVPTSRHMANLLWSSGREHFMDASNAGLGPAPASAARAFAASCDVFLVILLNVESSPSIGFGSGTRGGSPPKNQDASLFIGIETEEARVLLQDQHHSFSKVVTPTFDMLVVLSLALLLNVLSHLKQLNEFFSA